MKDPLPLPATELPPSPTGAGNPRTGVRTAKRVAMSNLYVVLTESACLFLCSPPTWGRRARKAPSEAKPRRYESPPRSSTAPSHRQSGGIPRAVKLPFGAATFLYSAILLDSGRLVKCFLNFFSSYLSNLSFFHENVCQQHLKFAFPTAKRTIYSKIGVSCLTRHVTPTPFRWLYGYPLAG